MMSEKWQVSLLVGLCSCDQVDHVNRHLEESERGLQERLLKLEGQRIHLEEVHKPMRMHTRTQTSLMLAGQLVFTLTFVYVCVCVSVCVCVCSRTGPEQGQGSVCV